MQMQCTVRMSLMSLIQSPSPSCSRFCQRMVPVVKVCHASLAEIEKEAESVLAPHFHPDDLQEATVSEFTVKHVLLTLYQP